jgi:hypothetical protein
MKKGKDLSGNPNATLAEAHAMLRAAREEAVSGKRFACRQAAQKVWLAATTAADAVAGPCASGTEVIEAFRKAWGARGEHVATITNAALHVGVHYSNARCTPGLINKQADELRKVISGPIKNPQMRARLRKRTR